MRNLLPATLCACLLGILTTACGGQSPQSAPPSQSTSGGTSGGPRLGWDQSAPSAEELRRYSFVLYVDGNPVPLSAATCGALAPDSQTAPCTSPLPALPAGQHTLEMTTRMTENGVVLESARSAPITYTVGGAATASVTEGARAPGADTGSVAELPYVVEAVVEGLDMPSALARLPDGRWLIAERGGRIRLAEGSTLRSEPAAELPDADPADDAHVSLAVAPDFAASRHVYVAYAALGADGARTGRVVRFRETGGTLGEPAVIVDSLPAASAAPRMRIGADGKIYVGTTTADASESDDLGSDAGKILRFNLDGTTPADNPVSSSPVFSFGYPGRFDFDWDPAGGNPWYVETTDAGAFLGRSEAGGAGVRAAELGSVRPAGVAFHAGNTLAEWRGSLFIAAQDLRCVLRVSGLSASPPHPVVARLFATSYGRIVAVFSGDDGLYFATGNGGTDPQGRPTDAVFRVRDTGTGTATGPVASREP